MVFMMRTTRVGSILSICLMLILAMFTLGQPARISAAVADDVAMQVAERATELFADGKFEALHSLFAPPIQEQISAAQLAGGVSQFGAPGRIEGPVSLPHQANRAVAVLHFETITLDLLIAVEPPGWLIGFQLVPHNAANLAGTELSGEAGKTGDPIVDSRSHGGTGGSPSGYEAPAYVNPDAFAEREVRFGIPDWELPGTYSYPVDSDHFPAVVLVHGSGPNDRDESLGANRPFRDVAWGLASRGIAVLRYDKRTFAYRFEVDAKHITPQREVIDDAVAAVGWLKQQPGVGSVYVLGHSLGGMLAPAIARQAGGDVHGIITLAGAARPLEDLVVEQTQYLAELDGDVTEAEAQAVTAVRNTVAALKAGTVPDGTMLAGAPPSYYEALRELLPVPIAQRLDIPMLILQGGRDYQVTADDFSLWQEGLSERANVTFEWFPQLNHLFMVGGTPPGPDDYLQPSHVAPGVIDAAASFLGED